MEDDAATAESRPGAEEALGFNTGQTGRSAAHGAALTNRGADLDRLTRLLPAGTALEFVKRLPRRTNREELFAQLEVLVMLIRAEEKRR